MKPVTVNVTDAEIDAGVRWSCGRCPVALAVQKCMKDGCSISADYCLLSVCNRGPYCYITTPEDVGEWMRNFDDWQTFINEYGGDVDTWHEEQDDDNIETPLPTRPAPISFTIELPEEVLRCSS